MSARAARWQIPEPDLPAHLEPGLATELDDATSSGVDLTGATLPVLREAQLDGSDLARVRAGGREWERVTLADCRLDGADLANLVWREGALMRCSLRDVRLTGALLAGLRARSVLLDGAQATLTNWHGARLHRVVLRGCDLTEATFTDTTLTDVLVEDCDLSGAQLSGLRCQNVQLRGCRLEAVGGVASLRGARVCEEGAIALLPAMAREMGITIGG